jgi:hypothetical protein
MAAVFVLARDNSSEINPLKRRDHVPQAIDYRRCQRVRVDRSRFRVQQRRQQLAKRVYANRRLDRRHHRRFGHPAG